MTSVKEMLHSAYEFSRVHNFMVPLAVLSTFIFFMCLGIVGTYFGSLSNLMGFCRRIAEDIPRCSLSTIIYFTIGLFAGIMAGEWLSILETLKLRGERSFLLIGFIFASLILYFFRPVSHQEENTT